MSSNELVIRCRDLSNVADSLRTIFGAALAPELRFCVIVQSVMPGRVQQISNNEKARQDSARAIPFLLATLFDLSRSML